MDGRRRDERGLVLVLFALCLVALLTITAIVIDLGNARQTKRDTQNDVDAAALAGAAMYDGSTAGATAARARAVEFLSVNSRDSSGAADADVRACTSPDTCTIEFLFTPSPAGVAPTPTAGTKYCMRVRIIDLEVDAYFSQVIGINHTDVSATANGCRKYAGSGTGSSFPASQSIGTCPNPYESFESAGNDNLWVGDIVSSGGARDTGTGNSRTGSATAQETPSVPGTLWAPPVMITTPSPTDPIAAAFGMTAAEIIASYGPTSASGTPGAAARAVGLYNNTSASGGAPNASFLTNDQTFSSNIPAGIYFSNKKITVSGTGVTVTPRTVGGTTYTGVILVSDGDIVELSGNGIRLTPFSLSNPHRMTIVGGRSTSNPCSDEGVKLSGECNRADGLIYSPFLKLTNAGNGGGHDDNNRSGPNCADTPTYMGSAVGFSLKLEGERNVYRGGTTGSGITYELLIDA